MNWVKKMKGRGHLVAAELKDGWVFAMYLCWRCCFIFFFIQTFGLQVQLMNKIKEEAQKSRQVDILRSREINQLKKEQRLKDSQIKTLEAEKKQKELVLKRKQEEVSCPLGRSSFLFLIWKYLLFTRGCCWIINSSNERVVGLTWCLSSFQISLGFETMTWINRHEYWTVVMRCPLSPLSSSSSPSPSLSPSSPSPSLSPSLSPSSSPSPSLSSSSSSFHCLRFCCRWNHYGGDRDPRCLLKLRGRLQNTIKNRQVQC